MSHLDPRQSAPQRVTVNRRHDSDRDRLDSHIRELARRLGQLLRSHHRQHRAPQMVTIRPASRGRPGSRCPVGSPGAGATSRRSVPGRVPPEHGYRFRCRGVWPRASALATSGSSAAPALRDCSATRKQSPVRLNAGRAERRGSASTVHRPTGTGTRARTVPSVREQQRLAPPRTTRPWRSVRKMPTRAGRSAAL